MEFGKRAAWTAVLLGLAGASLAWRGDLLRTGARIAQRVDSGAQAPAQAPVDTGLEVHDSVAFVPPVRLRIMGEVIDLGVGDVPVVTVSAGGNTFSAQVSGANYVADIVAPPDAMVKIVADAPRVHSVQYAGSAALAKRLSGGDGLLTLSENPALRVSSLGTAISFLEERTLGRAPASDVEFERTLRVLASDEGQTDVGNATSLLTAFATGNRQLPQGFSTGYALIADQAAYATMLANVGGAGDDVTFRTSAYAPMTSLADVPAIVLLSSAMLPNGPTPFGGIDQTVLERIAPDRYLVHLGVIDHSFRKVRSRAVQPEYSALITSAGDLLLTPLSPAIIETTDQTNGSKRVFRTIKSRTYHRLTVGQRYSLWSQSIDWTETFPDDPFTPTKVGGDSVLSWGADLQKIARPVPSLVGVGAFGLPTFCSTRSTSPEANSGYALTECEYRMHRFQTGGAGATEDVGAKIGVDMRPQAGVPGPSFSWTSDAAGRLRVSEGEAQTDFWLIDDGLAGVDQAVFITRGTIGSVAGQTMAGLSLMTRNTGLTFDLGNAAGTWLYPIQIEGRPYPQVMGASYLKRSVGGRGTDFSAYSATQGSTTPSNWTVSGGRAYDTRYQAQFGGPGTSVQDCPSAFASGATACAPSRVRYFRPLARWGNRVYGLVEFYTQTQFYANGYTGPYTFDRTSFASLYTCTEGGCFQAGVAASQPVAASPAARSPAVPLDRDQDAHLRLHLHRLRP